MKSAIFSYHGRGNQNYIFYYTTVRIAIISKRKGNTYTLIVGIEITLSTIQQSMEVPQKSTNVTTIQFSYATWINVQWK
jgi:hypothetical protein